MKAVIFNSGLGRRMGKLTKDKPKCLLKLYNDETILERQIRKQKTRLEKRLRQGAFADEVPTDFSIEEFKQNIKNVGAYDTYSSGDMYTYSPENGVQQIQSDVTAIYYVNKS